MIRPTVQRHRNRNSAIRQLRNQLRDLDSSRTHANFTRLLSGYTPLGAEQGPYSGVRLIENERQVANGDTRHLGGDGRSDFAGNFAKGLPHRPLNQGGLPNPDAYRDFANRLNLIAADARTLPIGAMTAMMAIDEIDRPASSTGEHRPYTNALSGVGALTNTLDPMAITIPPAPEFDGEVMAGEMAELYWMAALRDTPFASWSGDSSAQAAITNLDAINAQVTFAEHHDGGTRNAPTWSKTIDAQTLFRGSAIGANKGPYISQFLLRSFRFGTLRVDQRNPATNPVDYMTSESDWLEVQRLGAPNGRKPVGAPAYEAAYDPNNLRWISTLRDLAHYVHFDALHEAYFNAALILADIGAPLNPANPYAHPIGSPPEPRARHSQEGFGTFGGPSALVVLSEVATRALKTVWHQKWYVHRRLRPEAMGGRIHAATKHGYEGLAHPLLQAGGLAHEAVLAGAKGGTHLLPMAFAEGSPMHPAYGAGHATVAGACVTVLKAMFDPDASLGELFRGLTRNPGDSAVDTVRDLATTDAAGQLTAWTGEDLTVEGELNKLAANIAIGRNAAGVHYRTDYTKSLALGEAVAVGLLQELALHVVEAEAGQPVWALPTFAGHWITIDADGTIARTANGERPFASLAPSAAPEAVARFAA